MAVSPVDIEILQSSALQSISNVYGAMSSDDFHDLHGIYEKGYNKRFDGFNRYGMIFPDDEIDNFITYVFMVRPDLNIVTFNGGASSVRTATLSTYAQADPILNQFFQSVEDREIMGMLSSGYSTYHDFIPILVGRTNSLPIQDYEIRNDAVGQLFSNYKYYIPGKADESTSGISFTMDFRDDNNLSVAKLFYIWEYYIHQVMNGQLYPTDDHRRNKVADYYTSIYLIMCAADGQEIKYFSKITGAIPTGVPLSDFSFNRNGAPDTTRSISFVAANIEHWNPTIMTEFNYNSHLIHNIQSNSVNSLVNLGENNQNIYYGSSIGKPVTSSAMRSSFEPHHDINLNSANLITGSPVLISGTDGKPYIQWIKYANEQRS